MHKVIREAKAAGRNLYEYEAWELFRDYGIPVPQCRLATSAEAAAAAAEAIGYPVALKIVSRHILHKSDAGGVKTNISSAQGVNEAYQEIIAGAQAYRPGAEIAGILVCQMLRPGLETIIGMTKDASFGPTLMFGLGGIFVEVLKDVSFRVLPLTEEAALEMIAEIKGYRLLQGIRGEKPKDIQALAGLLLKTARLVEENPDIQELDINPCFVYEEGAVPVDARIIL